MNRFVDVGCPDGTPHRKTERGKTVKVGTPLGTRWLHNPEQRKWYMVKLCPACKGVHRPENVRNDRLVIPRSAM